MTARLAIQMMKWALFFTWPTVCLASSVTLTGTIDQLTFGVFLIVFAISTLSGVTALVIRVDRELRDKPGQPLPRPYLFVACHMLPSWLAGLLAFFICESQNIGDWTELIVIALSAFTGSKFIEAAVEQYLKRTHTKEKP